MRITHFWDRMNDHFGEQYATSVARDHTIRTLGSRTVDQALEDGDDAQLIWRAVCDEFDVPAGKR